MLSPARRVALSSCRTAALRTAILPETALLSARHTHVAKRCLHASPSNSFYKELWIPMRVKIPWVDALAQSKEESQAGESGTRQEKEPLVPDLTPRKMSDSYFAATLPLAEDKWLLDKYLNASGRIRLGTLFMDLDALAGVVAYRHTGDTVATVTAAVDRITLVNPLKEICNLQLSGQVTYATGRSSMEISLQVAKAPAEGEKVKPEDVLITCAFTMVSLDPATKKPVAVAPLSLETDEERRLFQKGEENYNAKKALRKKSSLEQAPDQEESNMIHSMWTTGLPYKTPGSTIQRSPRTQNMDRTILRSAMIMQPEDRNRHNFMIFGGFLLQQTFELAFCCAASFSHTRPTFVSLDPSTFENPVPVGSVLYLSATVAYTEPLIRSNNNSSSSSSHDGKSATSTPYTKVHVRVVSKVRDVEHATKKSTGVFHYTFLVPNEVQVMPTKYSEYMMWLDARRRAQDLDPIIASRFTEDTASAHLEGITE